MLLFRDTKHQSQNKWRIIRNEYKLFDTRPVHPDRVIVYMTRYTEFSGLADRFRTILSAYIIAKKNNRKFLLFHDKEFQIEQYLAPNVIDWRMTPDDMHRGVTKVQFAWFRHSWTRKLHPRKELHAYVIQGALSSLLETCPEGTSAASLFNELFRTSPYLDSLIANTMQQNGLKSGDYIAFHIRFLNFFEPVEEFSTQDDVTGTPEQQELMIERVHRTILNELHRSGYQKALLFSDSNRMLAAPHPPGIQVLPGTVGHILKEQQNEIVDKAFIDFFMLTHAHKIYSITGEHIYGGGFAWTAALLQDKPLHRIPLEN